MESILEKLLSTNDAIFKGIVNTKSVLENINAKSANTMISNGRYPLHYAVMLPNADNSYMITNKLISEGANINIGNSIGRTPLHIAVTTYERHLETKIIELLLENGADPSIADNQGVKPVDIASSEVIKIINRLSNKEFKIRANPDAYNHALSLVDISGEQASILVHNITNNGYKEYSVEDDYTGHPYHVYSDGSRKIKLACSSNDKIIDVIFINELGESYNLMKKLKKWWQFWK